MVNRCVCSEVPFWTIAALAKQGETFEQIQAKTGCCIGCGVCEPYVHEVIRTGATDLPVLTTQQVNAIMAAVRERRERAEDAKAPDA